MYNLNIFIQKLTVYNSKTEKETEILVYDDRKSLIDTLHVNYLDDNLHDIIHNLSDYTCEYKEDNLGYKYHLYKRDLPIYEVFALDKRTNLVVRLMGDNSIINSVILAGRIAKGSKLEYENPYVYNTVTEKSMDFSRLPPVLDQDWEQKE